MMAKDEWTHGLLGGLGRNSHTTFPVTKVSSDPRAESRSHKVKMGLQGGVEGVSHSGSTLLPKHQKAGLEFTPGDFRYHSCLLGSRVSFAIT